MLSHDAALAKNRKLFFGLKPSCVHASEIVLGVASPDQLAPGGSWEFLLCGGQLFVILSVRLQVVGKGRLRSVRELLWAGLKKIGAEGILLSLYSSSWQLLLLLVR